MTVALAVAVSVMVAAQDERAQTLQRQTEGLRGKLLLIHGSGDDNVHTLIARYFLDHLPPGAR